MNDVMRRKTINMIALLIIVFAMTAGLASPATCDDFYNKLQGPVKQYNAYSIPKTSR